MLLSSPIAVSLRILSSPFKISDPGGLPREKFVEKGCNLLKLVIPLIRRAKKKEWKEKIGKERKGEREERERRKKKKFQVRSDYCAALMLLKAHLLCVLCHLCVTVFQV